MKQATRAHKRQVLERIYSAVGDEPVLQEALTQADSRREQKALAQALTWALAKGFTKAAPDGAYLKTRKGATTLHKWRSGK